MADPDTTTLYTLILPSYHNIHPTHAKLHAHTKREMVYTEYAKSVLESLGTTCMQYIYIYTLCVANITYAGQAQHVIRATTKVEVRSTQTLT